MKCRRQERNQREKKRCAHLARWIKLNQAIRTQICIGCNKQARTWLLNILQGEWQLGQTILFTIHQRCTLVVLNARKESTTSTKPTPSRAKQKIIHLASVVLTYALQTFKLPPAAQKFCTSHWYIAKLLSILGGINASKAVCMLWICMKSYLNLFDGQIGLENLSSQDVSTFKHKAQDIRITCHSAETQEGLQFSTW